MILSAFSSVPKRMWAPPSVIRVTCNPVFPSVAMGMGVSAYAANSAASIAEEEACRNCLRFMIRSLVASYRFARLGLPALALYPPVGRYGIFPEILLLRGATLAAEVVASQPEHLGIRRPLIAIGPVAAVEHAILAEDGIELVQAAAIERGVFDHFAVDAAKDRRELCVDVGSLPELPQIGIVDGASGGVGGRSALRQVVQHEAQFG